jgi:hypothetical protein
MTAKAGDADDRVAGIFMEGQLVVVGARAGAPAIPWISRISQGHNDFRYTTPQWVEKGFTTYSGFVPQRLPPFLARVWVFLGIWIGVPKRARARKSGLQLTHTAVP